MTLLQSPAFMRPSGALGFRCRADRWVRRSHRSRLPTGYIHRPLRGLNRVLTIGDPNVHTIGCWWMRPTRHRGAML